MHSGENGPIKLRARDAEDLAVVSAMLQDAILPLGDMTYDPDEKSFILALNRFRWEQDQQNAQHERVHTGVRFDLVERVRYSGIDMKNRGVFLNILSIDHQLLSENLDNILIYFSGGGCICLEIDAISCLLSDFGAPWPTQWRPHHEG
ncbi:MAG: DUF2948 family protein [Alphaproteobacteria bacterium]|nr:DUF2948 family protein [Alphaproteobacteria bacterium]